MKTILNFVTGIVFLLFLPFHSSGGSTVANPTVNLKSAGKRAAQPEVREVHVVLDSLHRFASEAKGKEYFELYSEDAIFLGTDATERWSKSDFQKYAEPVFSKGKGWTYSVLEREVSISEDGQTAWFDERLLNQKYGECRGSGVLTKSEKKNPKKGWLIRQYNLSFPIPNDLANEFTARIQSKKTTPTPSGQ